MIVKLLKKFKAYYIGKWYPLNFLITFFVIEFILYMYFMDDFTAFMIK